MTDGIVASAEGAKVIKLLVVKEIGYLVLDSGLVVEMQGPNILPLERAKVVLGERVARAIEEARNAQGNAKSILRSLVDTAVVPEMLRNVADTLERAEMLEEPLREVYEAVKALSVAQGG